MFLVCLIGIQCHAPRRLVSICTVPALLKTYNRVQPVATSLYISLARTKVMGKMSEFALVELLTISLTDILRRANVYLFQTILHLSADD
jgi:hypothetical protein